MSIDFINNFIFGDGSNFIFGDGDNFVFAEELNISDETIELIEYYRNLLIIQYANKPKAKATVEAFLNAVIANAIIFQVRDGYNIDTAIGEQLNILGKYIGVDRFYEGQNLTGFFAFTDYDEFASPTGIGFADYTDYEIKEGSFLNYFDIVSKTFVLPDADYRQLLKLKIIINSSNFSHKEIDDLIYQFFENDLRATSAGNMIIDYLYQPSNFEFIKIAKNKDLLPKPMGVRLNYLISDTGWFGFTNYAEFDNPSDVFSGFTDYTDYDDSEGGFIQYDNLIE